MVKRRGLEGSLLMVVCYRFYVCSQSVFHLLCFNKGVLAELFLEVAVWACPFSSGYVWGVGWCSCFDIVIVIESLS